MSRSSTKKQTPPPLEPMPAPEPTTVSLPMPAISVEKLEPAEPAASGPEPAKSPQHPEAHAGLEAIVEDPKFMSGENVQQHPAYQVPQPVHTTGNDRADDTCKAGTNQEEPEPGMLMPSFFHGDSVSRFDSFNDIVDDSPTDLQLPLLRGESVFANVNSDEIMTTAMQNFYGLARQPSAAGRPINVSPEEARRDEFVPQLPRLLEGHSSGSQAGQNTGHGEAENGGNQKPK